METEQQEKLTRPPNWKYGSPLDMIAEKWTSRLGSGALKFMGWNRHIFSDIKAYFIAAVDEAATVKSSWIELRHEVAWEPQDLLRLMRDEGVKVVHARRQAGKTTELLKEATRRYGTDFIVVSPNKAMADLAQKLYWMDAAAIEFKPDRTRPHFISSWDVETKLRGHDLPVYVDEWGTIAESYKRFIIESNFQKAITS